MTDSAERRWQEWIDIWQADGELHSAPENIRRSVRRRTRLLAIWVAGEVAVALGFSIFLTHRALTQSDPIEKVAMALLAVVAAGGLLFSWWTWHGTFRVSTQTTAAFVALAVKRSRRLQRASIAGWAILIAELAIFVPWIWHRLYGGVEPPSPEVERFAWSFLAVWSAGGMAFLIGVRAWARREAGRLRDLIAELDAPPDARL